jgi:hypothetical protein
LLRRERLALERRIRQTSLAGTLFWLLQTAKDLPNSELALDLKKPLVQVRYRYCFRERKQEYRNEYGKM